MSGVWGEGVCCLAQQESSATSSGRGVSSKREWERKASAMRLEFLDSRITSDTN